MLLVDGETCTQACQSFLWRGAGVPSYDEARTCTCLCEEGWETFDIVGHASCVPRAAYNTFGSIGLVFTLFHLVHAAYNLKEQRRCEALQKRSGMMAVKMLVEVYREQLSMITILHAFVIGLFFALSTWLPSESVQLSGVALGVSHVVSGIGAVLTVQVLIRSVDPRLLKQDATVLKISAALTHPVGRRTVFSLVSVGAVILVILTSIDLTGWGYSILSIVYILVTVTRIVVIIMCSHSMVGVISKSMQRHAAAQRANGATATGINGTAKIEVDPKLAGAKRTILSALFFCINLTSIASAVLIFALVTDYGSGNPMVFLATPLAFGPMLALTFHIQLHSKRNRVPGQVPSSPRSNLTDFRCVSGGGTKGTGTGVTARGVIGGRVVPAETEGVWEDRGSDSDRRGKAQPSAALFRPVPEEEG